MDTAVIIVGIVALALGALIGWLFASREAAGARQTVGTLRLQLDEVVRERDANRTAASELAAVRAAQEERDRAHQQQLGALEAKFAEISSKVIAEAQDLFLKRADDRFRQSEENSGKELKALLQPVHERLERYETTVQKVEAERRDAFGLLSGQIDAMRTGTERVSAEAAKLVNALRNAPKARGRWGEQQLKNVLETCGLSEHCDFRTEVSVEGEDGGRLRPDVVVRVPGGQSLVIDAKVSLNEYQDAFGTADEAVRDQPSRSSRSRDPRAREQPRRQGLLVAVRRRARLCRDVHSRRAFPQRGARAGLRRCGTSRSTRRCCWRRRPI